MARRSARRLVWLATIFYGALLGAALVWRTGIQGESLLVARPNAQIHWGRDVLIGLVVAAAGVWLSRLIMLRTRAGARLARALGEALGPLGAAQCGALALASGIAEEAFFRGALQPRVGLLAASLAFAVAHFVPRRDLAPWSAFALAAGLVLGALYEATASLVAPVVAHAALNAVNLWRLAGVGRAASPD
jgi:membrane protease YdiL (CAAX protease family)